MVLAVHSSQLVSGLSTPIRNLAFYGVRGVQLFFIVSGFTLMLNHLGRPLRPWNFAARRVFRIAPMFYLGAALYLLLARANAMPLQTAEASALDIAATLLFVHGWLPSAINTVVPGGWSIAAEAMFYCCFPVLLLLARRPRALGLVVLLSLVVAVVTSVILRRLPGPQWLEMARYFWLVQFPAFAGGCWLAALGARNMLPTRGALACMSLSVVGIVIDSQLRGYSPQFVAVILLLTFAWAAVIVRPRFLERPLLVSVGKISFSFYILHFAILGMLEPLAQIVEGRVGATPTFLLVFAATLTIGAPLAWCTYRWIELPAIAFGRRLDRRTAA